MQTTAEGFVPVIVGSDIGAYSLARAFWEAYRARSVVFGRFASSPCAHSAIVDYRVEPRIGEDGPLLEAVRRVAREAGGARLLLFGCGDGYVRLIARNRDRLPEGSADPYPDAALVGALSNKREFYALLDRLGIAYPATSVIPHGGNLPGRLPFGFPAILKPADGAAWFAHPFPGQCKVHRVESQAEAEAVARAAWAAGYPGDLVLQEEIPGDDSCMRVVTCHVGRSGEALACTGHVLLEEHAPSARGNHAVIVTEPDRALETAALRVLAAVGYRGLANFDAKHDPRDGRTLFFELNVRQGRSNYYVTNAGANLARLVARDLAGAESPEACPTNPGAAWSVVPLGVAHRWVADPAARELLREAEVTGVANPLFMPGDLRPLRLARLVKHQLAQYGLYRRWLGNGGQGAQGTARTRSGR